MSRTKTPEQRRAEFQWLKPSQVAPQIGVDSADQVRKLIREGHLGPDGVKDVSRSKVPRYRISPEAVEQFNRESENRVEQVQSA